MSKPADTTRRDLFKLAGGAASVAAVGSALPSVARAAATMQGVLRPSVYRFKLGGFEITTLLDGYVQGNGPHPTFGNNRPRSCRPLPSRKDCRPTELRAPTSTRW